MANKGVIFYNRPQMYYMKTQFGYVTTDHKGWLTHTDEISDALIFTDFLNDGNPSDLYIRCMSGQFADYYLSSSWISGMGLYEHWISAAYWKWDDNYNLEIRSFKSNGNKMSYRTENGYFYTYNPYGIATVTKKKYELSHQRKDLPRTMKVFEEVKIEGEDSRPYYMKTQFGYVLIDYKGHLSVVGSKIEAAIFKDFPGSQAGAVHIMITNGMYADRNVSTYENGIMMGTNIIEEKTEFQFTGKGKEMTLVAKSGLSKGNKMALKKESGIFYAKDAYETAKISKDFYNAEVDEPKHLPK